MFQTCVDIPSDVTLNLGNANVMDFSGSKTPLMRSRSLSFIPEQSSSEAGSVSRIRTQYRCM